MSIIRWLCSFLLYVALAFLLGATTIVYIIHNARINLIAIIIDCIGIFFGCWYLILLAYFLFIKEHKFFATSKQSSLVAVIFGLNIINFVVFFLYNFIFINSKLVAVFLGFIGVQLVLTFGLIILDTLNFVETLKELNLVKKAKATFYKENPEGKQLSDKTLKNLIDKIIIDLRKEAHDNQKLNQNQDKHKESYWKNE